MVERTFYDWKSQFKILKQQNRYSIEKQVMVLIAYAVLHNIIKREITDDIFDNISQEIPHVGESFSSRRSASLIREGDVDV